MNNITKLENGQHPSYSVKETPWHRLGTVSKEHEGSAEVIKRAGLDWEVKVQPSIYRNPKTGEYEIDRRKFDLICSENGKRFGVVSKAYKVFQNREAFRFMDALVGASENQAIYETAGALGNGEIIWMMIRVNQLDVIGKGDEVLPYILLTNNHTGKGALRAFFTPVRVVCQNTLMRLIKGSNKHEQLRIPHNKGDLHGYVQEGRRVLKIISEQNKEFTEEAKKMTRVELKSKKEATEYVFKTFFPKKKMPEIIKSTRTKTILDDVMSLFEGRAKGAELESSKNTVWGLYNAVTEYIDYHTPSASNTPGKSLRSLLVGHGANVKTEAYKNALELVA